MISQLLDSLVFRVQRRSVEKYLKENNLKSGKVLDLGCGFGWYSELFGDNYTGIDNDSERLAIAHKKYPDSNFLEMFADQLSFPDESFDFVFSFSVLHHLTDDQLARTAGEVRRVLTKGGKFLVIDYIVPDKMKFLSRPFFYLDHAERRSHQQLAGFLGQSGLKIVEQGKKNFGIFSVSFFEILKV